MMTIVIMINLVVDTCVILAGLPQTPLGGRSPSSPSGPNGPLRNSESLDGWILRRSSRRCRIGRQNAVSSRQTHNKREQFTLHPQPRNGFDGAIAHIRGCFSRTAQGHSARRRRRRRKRR
eukprot:3931685-Alexandrium_andersonii.AAC.1